MPDLSISVEKAAAVPFGASPAIAFELCVRNGDPAEAIHTIVLRCQFQIEVTRRRYTAGDQEQLRDLFGEPERWGQTLRNMPWTNTSVIVPAFTGMASVSVPVPCSFDFNIAATKYFAGLSEGEIPLCLMFSGTIFYGDAGRTVQVAPISWETETHYRLPVAVWKEMMDLYYPNTAWLTLRRDVFEKLHQYKMRYGIPTWEETIERMLQEAALGAQPGNRTDSAESMAAKLEALRRGALSRS